MEMIEIEKFIQYKLGKRIRDLSNKKLLLGKFKVEGSDEFIEGDDFMAYEIYGYDASEVYECYIKYFNYTLKPHEKKRFAVEARWSENDLGDGKMYCDEDVDIVDWLVD